VVAMVVSDTIAMVALGAVPAAACGARCGHVYLNRPLDLRKKTPCSQKAWCRCTVLRGAAARRRGAIERSSAVIVVVVSDTCAAGAAAAAPGAARDGDVPL
jgi:hypothetical protein